MGFYHSLLRRNLFRKPFARCVGCPAKDMYSADAGIHRAHNGKELADLGVTWNAWVPFRITSSATFFDSMGSPSSHSA